MTTSSAPNSQSPVTNSTPRARVGLYLALGGLGMILGGSLISLPVLFFSPMIMCGITLFTIPLSLGAIVMGWKGRKENPRTALIAIFLGLALTPLAIGATSLFSDLVYKATA